MLWPKDTNFVKRFGAATISVAIFAGLLIWTYAAKGDDPLSNFARLLHKPVRVESAPQVIVKREVEKSPELQLKIQPEASVKVERHLPPKIKSPKDKEEEAIPATAKQDVALRLVSPKSPILAIDNIGEVVVREIKYTVALWNADAPSNDPLQIPTGSFDWIKPHQIGGPMNLFDTQLVKPFLKPGNRLIGSMSVSCATCDRGRTYIVYIVWDQGGWFAEIKNEKSGHVLGPKDGKAFMTNTDGYREVFFNALVNVPSEDRLNIEEWPPK